MHFICAINDIEEGTSKGFTIGEQAIFVVKKDDVLHAYHNRCPHLGIELEYQEDQFLDSEGALIQCSTHGALFLIDSGHCVSGLGPWQPVAAASRPHARSFETTFESHC